MSRLLPAVLACALVAGAPAPAAAQASAPTVSVEVDRRSLTLDEELTLTLTLSGSFERYTDPTLDGFEVTNQAQQQQIQIINGVVSRQQVLRYDLAPRRAGTFTLGAVRLLRGGQVVASSEGVAVTVREPATPPPTTAEDARDLEDLARQTLFLHADTARTRYYVGEPFVLSWNLYWRPDLNMQSADIARAPSLEGLLAEELLAGDERPRVRDRLVAGRRFSYVPRSVQLVTGLAPGRVTIDAMTVKAVVGDFFRARRTTVRSEPYTLEILPLPAEGRPEAFQEGNVGRFSLTASLRNDESAEPSVVQTGERLVLEATVSGTGSLLGVKAPLLDGGDAFEVQAMRGSGDDVVDKDASGMHGARVFRWLLTPLQPGRVTTPEVRFAFFDPEAGQYRTLTSPGVALTVEGRAVAGPSEAAALAGDDIGPALGDHALRDAGRRQLVGTPLFWLLLGAPFAAWAAVEARHGARLRALATSGRRRSRGALANARRRLKVAERFQRDGMVKDFFGHVARALVAYFEERANLPAHGMTHDELRAAAVEVGYPEALLDELVEELENCDFARFAPAASADARMRETLERARRLLDRLDAITPEARP